MSKRAQLPRRRRALLAVIVGLIVLAACVLGAVAAVQIYVHQDNTVFGAVSSIAKSVREHDWTNVGVLITGIVCAAIGFLLLLAGLIPARRPFVRLTDPDPETIVGVTKSGFDRDLAAVASSVDGVSSARASVSRRRVAVKVRSALRDTSGVRDAVEKAVQERIDSLQPRRPLSVRTRVRSGGD